MQWIWRSSVAQQKVMGWREFPPYVFHMWEEAFVEASTFASHSSRIIPEIAFEKQSLVKTGRGHRKVGFLKPGTIVWTSMETHPVRLSSLHCHRVLVTSNWVAFRPFTS